MTQWSQWTNQDFLRGIQGALPTGRAWPRDDDAQLTAFIGGHADSMFDVHLAAVLLLDVESDPASANELLSDFEADYGLPDPCTPLNATLQQRRSALLAKIAGLGGQSKEYFLGIAAAMGIIITIDEFAPFRMGTSKMGSGQLSKWPDVLFTWRINAPAVHEIPFRMGSSQMGDNLATVDNTSLACRLNMLKPAHTILLFAYS
jgi:uncharacterized protein YmfQ (DUF2313 family)